jgi:nucleotide-binding universal stress UspA family protein
MSYKSVLVNLDIDGPIGPLLKLAIDLARRFDARLIGFAAADAPLPIAVPDSGAVAIDVWEKQRKDIEKRFRAMRIEMERLAANSIRTDWRDMLDSPTRTLARLSRVADLIVTGSARGASTGDIYRAVDPGSVVLQTGRPVLVVADGIERLPAKKIVVAWKDTREARRAVTDAMPLLSLAEEVIIVTADREPDEALKEGVKDTAGLLAEHGIKARTEIIAARDEGERLIDFISSVRADLIVSGAYGHSRVREWVLGGVTRSLLDQIKINRLMAS